MRRRTSWMQRASHVPRAGLFVILTALSGVLPSALHAQSADQEPSLEALRELFQRPELTLGMLVQAVLDPGLDGAPAAAQVAAARLRLSGVLDGGFRYDLQTNFAASPSLLDARVGWSPNASFAVDAGRFKTPFSREFLTYAGSIDFVDRARVVSALAPNRQVGVRLSGRLDEYVTWAAGGFTGSSNSVPGEPLLGVFRLEGSGMEAGEDALLSLGGQVAFGRDGAIGRGVGGNTFRGDGLLVGLDGRFTSGALLLAGEYIRGDWEPSFGGDGDADGLYLTAGWHLEDDHQVLVRWDRYRSVTAAEADDAIVLGYNVWPTGASEIQVNGVFPLRDSALPYRLVVNFQLGF